MTNPIAFSTLACPNWPIEAVLERAAEYGYDALEWRGGTDGHIRPDLPDARLADIRRWQAQSGLAAVAVTAYTTFVSDSASERQASLDDLRRHCDMAAELGAGHVRVFLGQLPRGLSLSGAYKRAAPGLETAADYAKATGVSLALEPHDDFVRARDVAPLLLQTPHPALSVIWDIGNSYAAGETIEAGLDALRARLAYVQVKDGRGQGEAWQLTGLGQGEVPLQGAVSLLSQSGYTGAISVEWEWAWHPELDAPEVALPAALRAVRQYLAFAHTPSSTTSGEQATA